MFFDGLWFPFVLALLAGPAVFLFGIVMHRVLVNAVTGRKATQLEAQGHYAQLVLTLGIALVLQNGGLFIFGSTPVSVANELSYSAWEWGPMVGDRVSVFVNQAQTISAILALLVVSIFGLVMARTRLGKSLRASADNPDAAIYMGINVDRAYRLACSCIFFA